MKSITSFKNEFEFLSNFYFAFFDWDGHSWPTVEHAFQAAKTPTTSDYDRIRKAEKPGSAKYIGRSIILRDDWEQVKIEIMTELVWYKFYQNLELLAMLLDTDSAILIEGNWHHDNYWGDCFCKNCVGIVGKNMLGSILTCIREEMHTWLN